MDAKIDPKSDHNGTKNHPDAGFLRFWSVLGGVCFFDFFLRPEKVGPKSAKIRKKTARGAKTTEPAECAGLPER